MAILIVEDDDDARRSVAEALERAGYPTLSTASGHEAMVLLGSGGDAISLVVLDLLLPGMDGWQLADWIGDTKPIIVVTGSRTALPVPHARDVLTKPFAAAALVDRIRRYVPPRTPMAPRSA
jgi:two-component system OmpR family response regulator